MSIFILSDVIFVSTSRKTRATRKLSSLFVESDANPTNFFMPSFSPIPESNCISLARARVCVLMTWTRRRWTQKVLCVGPYIYPRKELGDVTWRGRIRSSHWLVIDVRTRYSARVQTPYL